MDNFENLFFYLNGEIINSFTFEFTGDNNKKITYDSDDNLWTNNGYFKIIDPKKVFIPNSIYVFSNINEFLISLFKEKIVLENVLQNDGVIIISSDDTKDLLLEFIYQNFYSIKVEIIVFFSDENFNGLSNLLDINNLYIKDKIKYKIENDILNIFNIFFFAIPIDFSTLDKYFRKLINFNISYENIEIYSNNKKFKVLFNF